VCRVLLLLLAESLPGAEVLVLDDGVVELGRSTPSTIARMPAATDLSAPARIDPPPQKPLNPFSPNRFALEITISQETENRLRYFQSLVGSHRDIADVIDRALVIA